MVHCLCNIFLKFAKHAYLFSFESIIKAPFDREETRAWAFNMQCVTLPEVRKFALDIVCSAGCEPVQGRHKHSVQVRARGVGRTNWNVNL